MPFSRRVFVLMTMLLAASVQAQQARITPEIAAALVQEAYSVQRLTAEGKLLLDSTPYAQQRTWGQYCASAWLLNDGGEFRRAVRAASIALYLGEQSRNTTALAYAKRDLAVSYSYSGNLEMAEKYAAESIAHPAQNASDVRNVSYKTLGDVALRRGNAKQAVEHYKQALNSSSFAWARLIRVSQANAYVAAGELEAARVILEDTRSFSSSPEKEMAWRSWGNYLLAVNKPDEALTEFRKYGAAASGEDGAYHRVWALEGEARALRLKGDSTGARASLLKAIVEAEGVRAKFRSEEFKAGIFGELQDVFTQAAFDLADAGEAEASLDVAERGRSRALLDQVRDRVKSGSMVQTNALAPAMAFRDIATSLAASETLVAYLTGKERSIAWVASAGAVRAVMIPVGRAQLASAVQGLRTSLVLRSPAVKEKAQALHQLLIKPLALQAVNQLIIVPHDVLHHLPFQALWDGERYLIESSTITYSPSASTYAHLVGKQSSSRPRRVVAFGNPDLGDVALSLPGAEREVNNIKAAYPEARVYLQREATKARFFSDAPQFSLVHVAAHAEFDAVDPLFSRVRLAPDQGVFGNIEAHEIYKLRLGESSLVTLSACESGMTGITRGDEIWGFSRSFLAAGAPAVLLSLWPVSDDSTERMMTLFYGGLQQKSLRDSLREAQLAVLKEDRFAHPFFWAAFNLTGDGR